MDKSVVSKKFSNALEHSEQVYEKFFLAKFFDLTFSYGDETCKIEFQVEDFMLNPNSFLHGGVTAFVIDTSMGHLCKKVVGNCVTIEMKVQYLRPIQVGKIVCEAHFLKKGKKISFLEADVRDLEGNLLAQATATFAKI